MKALFLALALLHPGPSLHGLRVTNGDSPFQGDRRLLTTVSPDGDGFRDAAIVSFRLDRAVRVRMDAVRTDTIRADRPSTQIVWSTSAKLQQGRHRLVWRPARSTPPRTYILRLTVTGAGGVSRYGYYEPSAHTQVNAPVVRVQGIDARFTRRSYAPGQLAQVSLATDARSLGLAVYSYRVWHPGELDPKTNGIPMTPPLRFPWRDRRNAPHVLRFVRAGTGRAASTSCARTHPAGASRTRRSSSAHASRLPSRVAVVLSTNTWQAYNFRDANGDGWGDSWYVSNAIHSVDLERPFLDFGVPFRFRDWDLNFISWLNTTGKQVDYLSDDDLESFGNGDALAHAYDLVVFPGHAEYTTKHAYDVVQRYRDLGGNLMFLSANNFFWKVERKDSVWCGSSSGARSDGQRPGSSACSTPARTTERTRPASRSQERAPLRGHSPARASGRGHVRPVRDRDRRADVLLSARHAKCWRESRTSSRTPAARPR